MDSGFVRSQNVDPRRWCHVVPAYRLGVVAADDPEAGRKLAEVIRHSPLLNNPSAHSVTRRKSAYPVLTGISGQS